MVAPLDDDIRQSVRVLELQNKDLWLRPTDLPWHFSMLVTIREMPFKNDRGRSAEKVKTREKLEEAKKQKTLKNSWTWKTAHSSSCSAWRNWSSDNARERSDWQSTADWNRSKDTRERSDWQSLADRNSSEKRRASVPIGSLLIGTDQIKCVRLRHGSHAIYGKEVIFIDPHKGIHGDENNVCL